MTTRVATVIRIERGWAELKLGDAGGCGRCDQTGACRSALLTQMFVTRCARYRVQVPASVRCGDEIDIELPEAGASVAAALAFGLPLFGLFLAALLATQAGWPEAGVAAAALLGLLGAYVLACRLAKGRLKRRLQLRVRAPTKES